MIHWFGGEPLLNIDPILNIEQYLIKSGINTRSSITTNGYLLNYNTINLLKQTNVKSLQITVDGTKDQHDQTRVLQSGEGTFDKIIANIKKCANKIPELKIIIRININKQIS